MVAMCFFGLTVNYVDRSNLSVALPKMKTALHLGPGAEGVVLAAFFASYAVFQLPAGKASGRRSSTRSPWRGGRCSPR
jgi:MFS transporter, ACS family, D-galactonate transporter